VLGLQLDFMILKVFSNLNDSMILRSSRGLYFYANKVLLNTLPVHAMNNIPSHQRPKYEISTQKEMLLAKCFKSVCGHI